MAPKLETTDTSIRMRSFVNEHDCAPSNEPGSCLYCGRRLRLKCNTESEPSGEYGPPDWTCCEGETWEPREGSGFECSFCGNTAIGRPRYRVVSRTPAFAGGAAGDYGDNAFCGLRCGYAFGVAMASLGRRLQPPETP